MKLFNKISHLLTFLGKSEIPTFPLATDFGYEEGDRFTVTRGSLSSTLTITWEDLVTFLQLQDIDQGTRKFREVLKGMPFFSDGYLMTIRKVDMPA